MLAALPIVEIRIVVWTVLAVVAVAVVLLARGLRNASRERRAIVAALNDLSTRLEQNETKWLPPRNPVLRDPGKPSV